MRAWKRRGEEKGRREGRKRKRLGKKVGGGGERGEVEEEIKGERGRGKRVE